MTPAEHIDRPIAKLTDWRGKVNDRALKNLVRAAIAYNQSKSKKKAPAGKSKRPAPSKG
ncbi:MAG: hypothetical protein Q8K93_12700 [Reyranella sp.]|uniref:hypothetical protein n=1 Tax=Reyranella sp. TaxID=1929291 RepID=UPI00272F1984|nr:hypothetical protein [Reyranella sp.]MDP1963050.1 hypothetical protein [Reyranella sp.]MDP2374140.1 hypothetical protein [Reyranella sp.]